MRHALGGAGVSFPSATDGFPSCQIYPCIDGMSSRTRLRFVRRESFSLSSRSERRSHAAIPKNADHPAASLLSVRHLCERTHENAVWSSNHGNYGSSTQTRSIRIVGLKRRLTIRDNVVASFGPHINALTVLRNGAQDGDASCHGDDGFGPAQAGESTGDQDVRAMNYNTDRFDTHSDWCRRRTWAARLRNTRRAHCDQ